MRRLNPLAFACTAATLAAAAWAESEPAPIRLTDDVEHQGHKSFRIETAIGTWLYHKQGAGFASLIDKDGNDWISYRPEGGARGHYRGIPNLVHPEGYFHPGGEKCVSRIVEKQDGRVTIESHSGDEKWKCRWDVYHDRAVLTVLSAPKAYWFLYEGTPAGKLDERRGYCLRPGAERAALKERWTGDLADPEWVVFGVEGYPRALAIVHHEADNNVDSYWPMQGAMTVFGFGRDGLKKFMTKTPARFTVTLVEETDEKKIVRAVEALSRPGADDKPDK